MVMSLWVVEIYVDGWVPTANVAHLRTTAMGLMRQCKRQDPSKMLRFRVVSYVRAKDLQTPARA